MAAHAPSKAPTSVQHENPVPNVEDEIRRYSRDQYGLNPRSRSPLACATMRRTTSLPGTMGLPAALRHFRGAHLSQLLALEFV
jgi:hypothetical protein